MASRYASRCDEAKRAQMKKKTGNEIQAFRRFRRIRFLFLRLSLVRLLFLLLDRFPDIFVVSLTGGLVPDAASPDSDLKPCLPGSAPGLQGFPCFFVIISFSVLFRRLRFGLRGLVLFFSCFPKR